MVSRWNVVLTRAAQKEAKYLASAHLKPKTKILLEILAVNPYQNPPPYEKLGGDLKGYYARRINLQHRLVYEVLEKERTVKIIRMWTHYE